MLFYSKVHAAIVVALTVLVGLVVDRSVPYFPIEISRTGTGPYSSLVFKWGSVSLILSLIGLDHHHPSHMTWRETLSSPFWVWLCIVVIAWWPDHSHLVVHGAAVVLMMTCVVVRVLISPDARTLLPVVLVALAIEGARMVIKGFIVLTTELDMCVWDWRTFFKVAVNEHGVRDQVVDHIKRIMFEDTGYCYVPHITLPVMRVTGAMQWMALYLLTTVY